MNTGMQDAWNLGWKLALVALGRADEQLLDTYEAERWPVGRNLLRYTDRLFGLFTRVMSGSALAAWFRRTVVARLLPLVFRSRWLRGWAFRFVSELAISYRGSPAVGESGKRLRSGPRAGDRLPDARVERDGRTTHLQEQLSGPAFQLLLCGEPDGWDRTALDALLAGHPDMLTAHFLSREARAGVLVDAKGDALARLGVRGEHDTAQYLVRPDGYIAFRCGGRRLDGLGRYLARWRRSSA